ncbi:hypothetical protein HYT26_00735 [Candidatus Pacearchaeota archaeon]|nr:hypothetical protein [Candidatus Pacearchaeota archaeon]
MGNKVNRMTLMKRELREMKKKVDEWYESETNVWHMGRYATISRLLENILSAIDSISAKKKQTKS